MAKDDESLDATTRAIRDRNLASSLTSQQYLNPLRETATVKSLENTPEIVVVSIPDVSTLRRGEVPASLDQASVKVPAQRESRDVKADLSTDGPHNNPAQSPTTHAKGTSPNPSQSSNSSSVLPTKNTAPIPAVSESSAAAAAFPGHDAWWFSVSSLSQDRPLVELSRRVLAHFPSIAPATLMIASADSELSTNRSTARIAACVARLTGCRVLLVDANWESNLGRVKQSSGPSPGLAEVLAEQRNWNELVIETQESRLFVLPCGYSEVATRQIGNDTLPSLNSQWQREYTYVFINAGHVKQLIARRFAMCCDGTYVLVGLNQTTKRDAQSAMKLLVENHARVLGAIVFDTLPQA